MSKIRSQVITMRVYYDADFDGEAQGKSQPAEWDWSDLIDEPIRPSVEILAAGPVVDHLEISEVES